MLAQRIAVIARSKQGQLIPGFLEKGRFLTRGVLKMTDPNGDPVPIDIHKLKAVFFVRDFVGDRDFREEKSFHHESERPGLRVRLRFEDNESLEGVAENSRELLTNVGFFFWPSGAKSNNQPIYVVKSALIGFTLLGVRNK